MITWWSYGDHIFTMSHQQTARTAHTPVAPGHPPRDPGTCSQWSTASPRDPDNYQQHQTSFHHQAAAPNQLPVSTNRQQHHISQPPARHPANQLLTLLPATPTSWQQGLLLFRYPVIIFFYCILVWAICTGIK